MGFPKLVIASDRTRTGVLLDGIFIGKGIERLDFSTQNETGEMKSTTVSWIWMSILRNLSWTVAALLIFLKNLPAKIDRTYSKRRGQLN